MDMSETTMLTTNGRTRKSLAEQIDRLDGILDGLADGLNQAVVTAVQEAVSVAVREAVQAVLTEVATNPDLLARLGVQPAAQPTADEDEPEEPTRGSGRRPGLTERLGRVAGWVKGRVRATWQAGANLARQARQVLSLAWAFVTEPLRRFKGQVLLTLAVGAVIGLAAFLAGPWLAAGAGFLGSAVVVVTDWLWDAAGRLHAAWGRLLPRC
jgi:hypothetical protein